MLALYWLFNGIIPMSDRRPDWDGFLHRAGVEAERCSIEIMVVATVLGQALDWPAVEVAATFDQYQQTRHRKTATRLPRIVEVAVMAAVANLFLTDGCVEEFERWIDRGILDAAGAVAVQDYLRRCRADRRAADVQHVLGRPLTAEGQETIRVEVADADIRLRAYLKWVDGGKPVGSEIWFWLAAERELRSAH